MNVNSVIDSCIGLSYYELESFAGENYKKVYSHISANYSEKNANSLLIGTIFTCIASDGKLTEKEWRFISSFIGGYTYDEAFDVAGEFYNDEAQKIVKELVEILPGDISEALIKLCVAVLCVDGNIEHYESTFLRTII